MKEGDRLAVRVARNPAHPLRAFAEHVFNLPPMPKVGKTCPQCGSRLFPRPNDPNRHRCERCTYEIMGA